jgi:hypothetical protein
MPFALAIIGLFLLIAAVRGTADGPNGLFALVSGDFTQPPGFAYWMVAILIVGAVGYIPKAKPISVAFLWLVVLVLFLSKGDPTKVGGGFFTQFVQGLQSTTTAQSAAVPAAPAGYTLGTPVSGSNPPGFSPLPGQAAGGYNTPFPALSNIMDQFGIPGSPVTSPLPASSSTNPPVNPITEVMGNIYGG